ncbi:MAG TPA: hypothetical protein VNS58_06680 [Puia sp.]|nr:hypothetical protein [Puia sp.]
MKKGRITLWMAFAILFACTAVKAQYEPRLVSIVSPGDWHSSQFRLGDLINVNIGYSLDAAHRNEEALTYLNDYNLVIDGIPYEDGKIQKMTVISNTLQTSDTARVKIYSVTYQAKLPSGYKDDNGIVLLSDFWSQHFKPLNNQRPVNISFVSAKPGNEPMHGAKIIELIFYDTYRIYVFLAFFLILFTLVIIKASDNGFTLLRDDSGCTNPLNNPFSLSRVQVFVWTFVLFSLVAYLWGVTDIFPEIKASHLVLLGIAFGQKILAQMIDANNPPVKSPTPPPPPTVPPPPPPSCSRDFFTDLISDSTGLSMSRLQFLIATFIFLVVFTVTAIQKLRLVDFTIEQLGLMGTSAGLYLWNKRLDQK